MILHNSVRRIGLFVGCMLLCTMFTAHAASTCECVPPTPLVVHEASEGEKTTEDVIVYNVMLAEAPLVIEREKFNGGIMKAVQRKAELARRAGTRDTVKDAVRSFTRLENENVNGYVFSASNDALAIFIEELLRRKNISILSSPQITTVIGTEAKIEIGTEIM